MSRWWRAEDTSIDHPKLLLLSDAMHRAWYTLMCVASANGGELPPVEHIAARLRMKPGQVAAWLAHLVSVELFDNDDGTFRPHNWDRRQYKTDVTDPTNATRQKRYREKQRNCSNAVTDKRPETEQKQITETDQKETREDALSYDFEFAGFWEAWPNKVGKPAALKAFLAARKRDGLDAIVDGVFAYIREKPPDRSWLNPATFLNQDRWKDQPATVSSTNGKPKSALIQAADDLVRKLASFDGPARRTDEIRSGASGPPLRLLSHGGGE